VNTTHAFQLRAESKHAFQQRQLPPRAATAAVLAGWMLLWPLAVLAAESPARDELRAAEMLATALLARQAGKEEMQKMERIYADLVAKYPKDALVKNDQAAFLWSIGAHARAVEAWLAAEKLDPNNAEVLDHLGGSFLAGGHVKKAAGYYARATANAPENAAYHFNYANVAFMFRHELLDTANADSAAVLRRALSHFAQATRLQPLNADYARAYAETFYTVADPDWAEALKAWQHVYEISPGKDFALLNLARVHMKLGNKPEARETLARIQDSKFDRLKARLRERIEAE
jgi:tetratricopeptide (TPR) repeat protein